MAVLMDFLSIIKWIAVGIAIFTLLVAAVGAVMLVSDALSPGSTLLGFLTDTTTDGSGNWRYYLTSAFAVGNQTYFGPGTNALNVLGAAFLAIPGAFVAIWLFKFVKGILSNG